jgi:hypothetical protein
MNIEFRGHSSCGGLSQLSAIDANQGRGNYAVHWRGLDANGWGEIRAVREGSNLPSAEAS